MTTQRSRRLDVGSQLSTLIQPEFLRLTLGEARAFYRDLILAATPPAFGSPSSNGTGHAPQADAMRALSYAAHVLAYFSLRADADADTEGLSSEEVSATLVPRPPARNDVPHYAPHDHTPPSPEYDPPAEAPKKRRKRRRTYPAAWHVTLLCPSCSNYGLFVTDRTSDSRVCVSCGVTHDYKRIIAPLIHEARVAKDYVNPGLHTGHFSTGYVHAVPAEGRTAICAAGRRLKKIQIDRTTEFDPRAEVACPHCASQLRGKPLGTSMYFAETSVRPSGKPSGKLPEGDN